MEPKEAWLADQLVSKICFLLKASVFHLLPTLPFNAESAMFENTEYLCVHTPEGEFAFLAFDFEDGRLLQRGLLTSIAGKWLMASFRPTLILVTVAQKRPFRNQKHQEKPEHPGKTNQRVQKKPHK